MRAARAEVRKLAMAEETRSSNFATTLTVCVVTSAGVSVAQVGDGVICLRGDGGMHAPFPPQRGTYANETTFITAGRRLPRMSMATVDADKVDAFCLSSDGLKLVITRDMRKVNRMSPSFESVFDFAMRGGADNELARYLDKVDDRSEDDKSLVIAVRTAKAP